MPACCQIALSCMTVAATPFSRAATLPMQLMFIGLRVCYTMHSVHVICASRLLQYAHYPLDYERCLLHYAYRLGRLWARAFDTALLACHMLLLLCAGVAYHSASLT